MDNKRMVLLVAPVTTSSGYGQRSRDIATSLIKSGKYELYIVPTRWGDTPQDALDPKNLNHIEIAKRLTLNPQLSRIPDIFIQVTIPNEFMKAGTFNIGITAGIETNICDPSWIEGCNRMDLVITSSEHSKNVFMQSVFEKRNDQTKQIEGNLKLTTPIEVLFEGANLDIYKKLNSESEFSSISLAEQINKIQEDFCFLFVGHWLTGDLGADRKDVGMLIKTFLETFKKKSKKPALILKTSGGTYSIMDREAILAKINAIKKTINGCIGPLPPVYLLHGNLSDSEMNELYNHKKIKAHISFTKGEGFGRPLLEASISAKPVIASKYSGHLDFLSKFGVLLNGALNEVHSSAVWQGVINSYAKWFTVDYGYAQYIMKDVYENYKNYMDNAKRLAYQSRTNFSLDQMQTKLDSIIDTYTSHIPRFKQIQLPDLSKIKMESLPNLDVKPAI